MEVGGGLRERRKEVALGRLRTVSLILILGAWGGATKGAVPDDAAAAPSTATRQAPPAPPIKYLEAGAKLFNNEQFDMASKYLEAANRYRDHAPGGRALDARRLPQGAGRLPTAPCCQGGTGRRSAGRADDDRGRTGGHRRVARDAGRVARPGRLRRRHGPAGLSRLPRRSRRPGGCSTKAANNSLRGNYDLAQAKVDEARSFDVQWGLFDDTPDKLQEDISKVRPAVVAKAPGADAGQAHDRRTAKAKLREARAMMNDRQFAAGRGPRPGGQAVGPLLRPVRRYSRQGRRRGQGTAPPRPDPQDSRLASGRARVSMMSWCTNRDST